MRSYRVTLIWLVVLAAVILSIPAAAFATSAGDNQYTDPLAGNHNGSGGSHSTSTPQTPTPTPTPIPAAGGSSGTPSPTPSLSSSSPTASAASSTSSSTAAAAATSASSASTLPRTGFDAGLAGAIGAGMIGIGLMTRRRIRCSDR